MADISQSILRRIKELYNDPRGSVQQMTDHLGNFNKGRAAEAKNGELGYRDLRTDERAKQLVQGGLDNLGGGLGALGVIKSKGGNWLGNEIATAMNKLKRGASTDEIWKLLPEKVRTQIHRDQFFRPHEAAEKYYLDEWKEAVGRATATDKFVDGALTKYLKNDMATPNDPVRALAEQGILHTNPDKLNFRADRWGHSYGDPNQQWLAQSDLAKRWEGASDNSIGSGVARDFKLPEPVQISESNGQPAYVFGNEGAFGTTVHSSGEGFPWRADRKGHRIATGQDLDKVMYEAQLHELESTGVVSKDQVQNNPWLQTLPPQERVFGIADKRNMAEDLGLDDLINKLNEAMTRTDTPEHLRLVPEDLQQMGMDKAIRHVHAIDQFDVAQAQARRAALPVYKDFGDGFRLIELNQPGSFANESDIMGHSVRGYEPHANHRDYVKSSGEGGYEDYGLGGWEAIKSGKAKVYSLVDKKGEPHVTIETSPKRSHDGGTLDDLRSEMAANYEDMPQQEFEALVQQIYNSKLIPAKIHQIKGKNNLRPNDEYLQYIQDFIRSGEWDKVKDLSNSGLVDMRDLYGAKLPEGTPRFMTYEEQQVFNKANPNLRSKMSEELDKAGFGDDWEVEDINF